MKERLSVEVFSFPDSHFTPGIMDGVVSRKRMVDGKPTSLCDLGMTA
jgi:hypothetical protein